MTTIVFNDFLIVIRRWQLIKKKARAGTKLSLKISMIAKAASRWRLKKSILSGNDIKDLFHVKPGLHKQFSCNNFEFDNCYLLA